MRCISAVKCFLGIWLITVVLPFAAWADEEMPPAETYLPSISESMREKNTLDDNRDLVVTYHPKDIMPPEVWKWMHFDEEEMKKQMAELLGFTAPELVGKIAPEIKPGRYTYKDVEKLPGLKELFPEVTLRYIKEGGPPFICNIMDFEIQPTRQYYQSLPVCQVTKQNLGKTKLDKEGYIVPRTWEGGIPFPRPGGKFKAQQVYYNFEKNSLSYDDCYTMAGEAISFDRNLKIDKYSKYTRNLIKLMGRSYLPPFGWFDERAEKRGEFKADALELLEPRATRGLIRLLLRYDDPNKMDPTLMYLPQMRRIRKMSSTDTQDPIGDSSHDDTSYFSQKVTPKRYPYKFDIIEEREYLLPWSYNTGTAWIDSKNGYALRDVGFMRRPCYVLQMTQLDPNYIYSKRVYYIDKEAFLPGWGEFYDQKGRLYRTYNATRIFFSDTGQIIAHGAPAWQVDFRDTHSTCQVLVLLPANHTRRQFNMENLIRRGK